MLAHSKKGKVLKIIGLIFLAIIIIIACAFIYLYNFHVFKRLIICITPEIEESDMICESHIECTAPVLESLGSSDIPEFLKVKIDETVNKVVFCEGTCKNKKIYSNFIGDDTREIERCQESEEEIAIDIKGREGLQLLKLLKESSLK